MQRISKVGKKKKTKIKTKHAEPYAVNHVMKTITKNNTPSVFFSCSYLESLCERNLVKVRITFKNGGSIDLSLYGKGNPLVPN